MRPRHWLVASTSVLIAACTYKEYNTYNEIRVVSDAGVPSASGGSGGATSVTRGGDSGAAGAAGSAEQAGAGGTPSVVTDAGCTGCLRLTLSGSAQRNLELEFPAAQNLSESQLSWRMRVRDFSDGVSLTFYARNGDAPDDYFLLANVALEGGSDWQDLGADLSTVPNFAPPLVLDAGEGGGAGFGFDMGFPFDKTKVERVGVFIQARVPQGVLTPLTLEIDSLAFSGHPALDVSFATSQGGLQLVEGESAVIAGATLQQVDE